MSPALPCQSSIAYLHIPTCLPISINLLTHIFTYLPRYYLPINQPTYYLPTYLPTKQMAGLFIVNNKENVLLLGNKVALSKLSPLVGLWANALLVPNAPNASKMPPMPSSAFLPQKTCFWCQFQLIGWSRFEGNTCSQLNGICFSPKYPKSLRICFSPGHT